MAGNILYEDKDVIIRDDRLIIKCYFFPLGSKKTIYYHEVERVEMRSYAWKGKLWGMSATEWGYWMPGDLNRWDYDRYVAVYNGSSITPCFTCKDMDRAYQILNDQLAKYREGDRGREAGSNEGEELIKRE